MLCKHFATVALIGRDQNTAVLIRNYFDLPPSIPLLSALTQRGLFQADLVLALLKLRDAHTANTDSYIALLIGHPIQIGPPCLTQYRAQSLVTRIVRSRDERRITHVISGNPRQPKSGAFMQWHEYRIGRTLGQLYARGVTKRDVRRALKRQWIKVEQAA